MNVGHVWVTFEQNTKAIALRFGQNSSFSSLINLESNSINVKVGHVWVICEENTKAIALRFGQNRSFSSLFNLKSKSINVKVGHVWVICEQNTKNIALLCGQTSLIVITCQSGIKINQFQMWTFCGHL